MCLGGAGWCLGESVFGGERVWGRACCCCSLLFLVGGHTRIMPRASHRILRVFLPVTLAHLPSYSSSHMRLQLLLAALLLPCGTGSELTPARLASTRLRCPRPPPPASTW